MRKTIHTASPHVSADELTRTRARKVCRDTSDQARRKGGLKIHKFNRESTSPFEGMRLKRVQLPSASKLNAGCLWLVTWRPHSGVDSDLMVS
jgi:hypothetical protein